MGQTVSPTPWPVSQGGFSVPRAPGELPQGPASFAHVDLRCARPVPLPWPLAGTAAGFLQALASAGRDLI